MSNISRDISLIVLVLVIIVYGDLALHDLDSITASMAVIAQAKP